MFMESNDWRFEGLKPQMDTDEHRLADFFLIHLCVSVCICSYEFLVTYGI
jgi:hypothetical protein